MFSAAPALAAKPAKNGRYIGLHGLDTIGAPGESSFRSGRFLRSVDAGNAYLERVASLRVKENGSVGWIMRNAGQVYAFDAAGRRLLDPGPGVQTDTLKLSGSTLTWIRNGVLPSATLN